MEPNINTAQRTTRMPRRPRRPASTAHETTTADKSSTARSSNAEETTEQQAPREHEQASDQQQAPKNGAARPLGNGTIEWHAFGQVVYVRDATKHPPMASYTVAILVGLCCIGAVFWQMNTTYVAFSNMIFNGSIWLHLSREAQNAARTPVNIICALIAVSFQAPLLFFAFKVDKRFAQERHKVLSMSAKIGLVWDVFKEIVAANLLLAIWAGIAIVADTIGDVDFISIYTDSPVVLFFYGTGLYGLSTVGLSESLQILWDGMVTSEWLKHVRAANAWAMMKLEEAMQRKKGQASA